MAHGQLKTATEAIPLLPLPLEPRSSEAMNEMKPSAEMITDCDNETVNGRSRTVQASVTDTHDESQSKDFKAKKCVRLCLKRSFLLAEKHQQLRTAVSLRDVESVKLHLAEGAPLILNRRDDENISILHFCLEEYCSSYQDEYTKSLNDCLPVEMEIIKEILTAAEQAKNECDILNALDEYGRSPLYIPIAHGYLEVVKELVESGANVENVSDKNETALHVAVQCPDILKHFLDDSHNIGNLVDTRGYAAIHAAVKFDQLDSFKLLLNKFGVGHLTNPTLDGSTALHMAAENGSTKLVEIIMRHSSFSSHDNLVKRVDRSDETALNRSAKHGHKAVTALLLRNGAVLSDKGRKRRTAIEQIASKFPDPLKFFKNVFDGFITEEGSSPMCKERMVHVDYKVLTNNVNESMSQIKVIEELVRCGQSKLLLHPLIESLLYLKWRCLLPVFYTIIAIYAFFLVSFNAFLVTTFYRRDRNANNCTNSFNETNVQCHTCFDVYDWIWIIQIYLSIFLLLGQECVYIYLQRRRYLKHLESRVKLCLLALAALVPPGVICGEPAAWLRHVSCAALLLSWVQAMFLLSRFPDWGYYVLMFERVAFNISKILLTSICLVIGFSFCFMIQYRSEPPFDGPEAAFVKTLVMMTSEFDYSDGLFPEEHNGALDNTRSLRLLFVIFVIFIAIALMNFMIGVAVSDINELNKIGNIRRLEKQVELLSTLDVLVDTVLVKLFKRLKRIKFHYKIYKDIESDEKWTVDSIDEYEQNLTPDLQNVIIKVAKRKAQRKKDNHNKNKKDNRFDVMYDTLMKLPPYLERDREEGEAKALDEKLFYKNTEESILLMQNKITSLEILNKDMKISINELKENMNKILAIMSGYGTKRNEETTKCDHLKFKNYSSLTNRAHSI